MLSKEQFTYISNIVNKNKDLVDHNYKGKDNQILIAKELTDQIIKFAKEIKSGEDNLKESVKNIIRKVFDLCESDVVLFKNGSVFIKLFENEVIEEKQKGTIAERFNGISEDELKSFHDEFFADEEHQNFFSSIAKEFVDRYLYKNRISNSDYEKNVFGYILNITLEHLISKYDNSDGFFTGFAGYIFRIHFNEVFGYIADIMLEKISAGSDFMVKFLEYYSAGVIVSDGHKYQVPTIKTENGLRWSVVSMLSIAKLYSKTKNTIQELEEKFEENKELIDELYIGELSPVEYHANYLEEKKEIENDISSIKKEIDKLSNTILTNKDESEVKILKQEIINNKKEILELEQEKEDLTKTEIDRATLKEYIDLQKELDYIKRQLHRAYRIINQNEESYLSLRDALVKALTSKKQQLD